MNYTISGTLLKKYDTNVVSDKFKKKEFVLSVTETNSQGAFTDTILFELIQDKVVLLDTVNEGDSITVQFGISGRAWTKQGTTEPRYFNNLKAWKIEKNTDSQGSFADLSQDTVNMGAGGVNDVDDSDDLPF